MRAGLVAPTVCPPATADAVADEPPVGSLFAAFLGYNPMEKLVPADTLQALPAGQRAEITGKEFFPHLISDPFIDGLRIAFTLSLVMCLIAAWASWMRGGHYVCQEDESLAENLADARIGEGLPA